jgi:hypothetical protein
MANTGFSAYRFHPGLAPPGVGREAVPCQVVGDGGLEEQSEPKNPAPAIAAAMTMGVTGAGALSG